MWWGRKIPSRQMSLRLVHAKSPLDQITNIPPRTFDLCRPRINRQWEIICVRLNSKYFGSLHCHITLVKIGYQRYQIDHYIVSLSPSHSDLSTKGHNQSHWNTRPVRCVINPISILIYFLKAIWAQKLPAVFKTSLKSNLIWPRQNKSYNLSKSSVDHQHNCAAAHPPKIYQKTALDEPKAGCKQHVFIKFIHNAPPYWNILTNRNRVTFRYGMRLIYQMKPRIFG